MNACTGIDTRHQLHRAAKGFLIKRAAAVTALVHSIYFTPAAVPCIETECIQYILPLKRIFIVCTPMAVSGANKRPAPELKAERVK